MGLQQPRRPFVAPAALVASAAALCSSGCIRWQHPRWPFVAPVVYAGCIRGGTCSSIISPLQLQHRLLAAPAVGGSSSGKGVPSAPSHCSSFGLWWCKEQAAVLSSARQGAANSTRRCCRRVDDGATGGDLRCGCRRCYKGWPPLLQRLAAGAAKICCRCCKVNRSCNELLRRRRTLATSGKGGWKQPVLVPFESCVRTRRTGVTFFCFF